MNIEYSVNPRNIVCCECVLYSHWQWSPRLTFQLHHLPPHHTNTHTLQQWTQDHPNPHPTSNHLPPMAPLTPLTTTNNNHTNAPPHPQHHELPSPSTQPPQSPTRSFSKERTQ